MPIPAEITRLTGISDADVAGQRIDDDAATSLIASTAVAIAHNAAFDAPRIERRLPAIVEHAWACSCNEVPWPELGFDGRKLGHLLMQMGMFHHGHRAAVDVPAPGLTSRARVDPQPSPRAHCPRLISRAHRADAETHLAGVLDPRV